VQYIQDFEGGTCPDDHLRGRVKTSPHELEVLGNCSATSAVVKCNLMKAVCVDDDHGSVTWYWVLAKHTGVI